MLALNAIRLYGGYPLIVGGAVRDAVMGNPRSKDVDVEVYRIPLERLIDALQPFGEVETVGAAFGVVKVHGIDADFSIPRQDNNCGTRHTDFEVVVNPAMSITDACRRRDLTINSFAYDPLTEDLHDPFNGLADMRLKMLRATDPPTFLDDPLRVMRVAQFVSRFSFGVEYELEKLCAMADLSALPGERLYTEWQKLLLGQHPDYGLRFLRAANLLRFFPELDALVGCQQEPEYHNEGDVYEHTALAALEARTLTDDLTVLWSVLLHDVGKPATTTKDEDGRIRSKGHDAAGVEPARAFLHRLRAPHDLIERVLTLVAHHLAPCHFVPDAVHSHKRHPAGPAAYRRLARTLGAAGTNLKTLYLVSKADHLGRAPAKQFPSGEEFLRRAEQIHVVNQSEPDVVMGRHLIARGYQPGPQIGAILTQCREYQYEFGLTDPDAIIGKVLSNG
jgi:tRNA nucleotidyltransferase (CCA-adding enzyme)